MNEAPRTGQEIEIPINGIHDLTRRIGAEGTDDVLGMVLRGAGVNTSAPGVMSLFQDESKEDIISLHQTYGSNNLLIVQTTKRIGVISMATVLGNAPSFTLTTQPTDAEEFMAKAIIVHHATAAGGSVVGNGGSTSGTLWEVAPLNQIVSQLNPDGTAATFITGALSSNKIPLATGRYRMRAWTKSAATSGADEWGVRVWNVTSNVNLFLGQPQAVMAGDAGVGSQNRLCNIFGDFELTTPSEIRIEHWHKTARATWGFGYYDGSTQSPTQIFRCVELIKLN